MKRIAALFLTCLLSVGLLCGCGAQQPEPALPEIIIGSDTYPPYVYLDDNGDPTGIDVEIATEAFRRMGYQAVFTTIDWEQKKTLVDSGEIDCIWGCFSMSGREHDYQWAGPYAISRQVIAVDAGSDIYTMGDLAGKTIAVQSTGKPEDLFLHHRIADIPEFGAIISLEDRACSTPRWTAAMWTLLPPMRWPFCNIWRTTGRSSVFWTNPCWSPGSASPFPTMITGGWPKG